MRDSRLSPPRSNRNLARDDHPPGCGVIQRGSFFAVPHLFRRSSTMSSVRQQAIQAIASAKHVLNRVDFKKTHVKDLYGVNVFNEEVQRQRLPKPIFKALQKTIKLGAPLDPSVADSIASAMRD